MIEKKHLVVLIVLDGWGVAPSGRGNAIQLARTPHFDAWVRDYQASTLHASSELVGLPWGEMGNSEAGHLNIGAGRIYYQPLPYINKAITDGSFFKNKGFLLAIHHAKKHHSNLHLMGLVSQGGIHSFLDHLLALLELCEMKKVNTVFVHAFLDGRDTSKDQGLSCIQRIEEKMKELSIGKIASISGRYYAMDRDQHWDRTEKAFHAIAYGESPKKAIDPLKAIQSSYDAGVYDEEFEPTVMTDRKGSRIGTVEENDAMIFFNFRADRARQITKAFTLPGFEKVSRKKFWRNFLFVTMMEYELELPVEVAFQKEKINIPLAHVISDAKLKQLHVAETEKYAHVTFFFNGGIEKEFPGEDRVLIPSVHVPSFDLAPEMAAKEIAEVVVERILRGKAQFFVVNFANADMVGHTGNLKAAIKAIETLDDAMANIVNAALHSGGTIIIIGDHGNAEEMINPQTGDIIKEHSTNPVPFLLIDNEVKKDSQAVSLSSKEDLVQLRPIGILADIAPTIIALFGLKQPKEMTGHNLIPFLLE